VEGLANSFGVEKDVKRQKMKAQLRKALREWADRLDHMEDNLLKIFQVWNKFDREK